MVNIQRIPQNKIRKNETMEDVIQSDYRRIVKSPSFRKLQDKTQVFPLNRDDFVRTRLTHSIEVALLTRDIITQLFKLIDERIEYCKNNGYENKEQYYINIKKELPNKEILTRLLECSSLIHDLGNPPFGHFGEEAIQLWFKAHSELLEPLTLQQQMDFLKFDGNAQTLRILLNVHDYNGSSSSGMRLSASVLDATIKYVSSSDKIDKDILTQKKMGYFNSEEKEFIAIKEINGTLNTRHPLAYLLEAADDIAYTISDIEDGYNNNVFDFYIFNDFLKEVQSLLNKIEKRSDLKGSISFTRKENETDNSYVQTLLRQFQRVSYYEATKLFLDNYSSIIQGEYLNDLFKEESNIMDLFDKLKKFCFNHIFNDKEIISQEIIGHKIIHTILDKFVNVALSINFNDQNQVIDLDGYQKRLYSYIPNNYISLYIKETKKLKNESEKLYYRLN